VGIPQHSTRRFVGALVASAFALACLASAAFAVPIDLVDHRAAGFVGQSEQGPLDQPVLIENYSQFVATFGGSSAGLANPYLAPSVAAFFANAGSQVYVVRVAGADDASLIGVDGGVPGASTGLQALRDVADVGAVAIPGATSQAVQTALIAHAESMGNRMAILDPVSANSISAVTTQRAGLSTTDGHAALYFPWVQAAPAGVSLLLPPCGFVAGVFARTALTASPTGNLASASSVSLALNSTQLSDLNSLGISTLRFLTGQGVLVWGARTLASNPEWQYLTVRRKGSAIAASIEAGTVWCLEQPNDVTLWTQLRSDMTNFMQVLFVGGWFQGVSPSQAYFVKCDETTMTAQDLAEGRTVMLVGFAPLTPGEFLVLRIVQQRANTTGVSPGVSALSLSTPHPNPFGARTSIAFALSAEARVTLRVHDIGGRLVRTLAASKRMAAGPHEQVWDGRDDAGAGVPAGVYLVRLQAGDRVLSRRVALVR